MPRLCDLPREILHQIFSHFVQQDIYEDVKPEATTHEVRLSRPAPDIDLDTLDFSTLDDPLPAGSRFRPDSRHRHNDEGTRALAGLCRTSRRLDVAARPLLYRTFIKPPNIVYNYSAVQDNETLRLFLRALLLNPKLTEYVQELFIFDWPGHLTLINRVDWTLSTEARQELKRLFREVMERLPIGFYGYRQAFELALLANEMFHKGSPDCEKVVTSINYNEDAEVALLLLLCPRLTRLAMAVEKSAHQYFPLGFFIEGEAPVMCPNASFVQLVMRSISDLIEYPMGHLDHLTHFTFIAPDKSFQFNRSSPLHPTRVHELLTLPRLLTLEIGPYDLRSASIPSAMPEEDLAPSKLNSSNITALTLGCVSLPRQDLMQLLSLCKSLTSLSLTFTTRFGSRQIDGYCESWSEVVDCFRHGHADSLVELKLGMVSRPTRYAVAWEDGTEDHRRLSPIRTLSDCQSLRALEIDQSAFLKLHYDGPPTRRPIAEVLPSQLQTLKITCFDSGLFPQMDAFLAGLPASHPELKKVEVKLGDFCGHDRDRAYPPHNLVRSAEEHLDRIHMEFRRRGIEFIETA